MRTLNLLLLTAVCLFAAGARAAALPDQVTLVSDSAVAGNPAPAAQTFVVTAGGSYTVTLTDLSSSISMPPMQSLGLAVATSSGTALQMSAAGASSAVLQPGSYTLQVLASAASGSFGAFSVQVAPTSGGAALVSYSGAVGPPSGALATGQSTLVTQFSIANTGPYTLTITDYKFPAALGSLKLIAVQHGVANAAIPFNMDISKPGGTTSTNPSVPAGTYDLFVVAMGGAATSAGLYGLVLSGGSPSAVVQSWVEPVGKLPAPASFTVSSAGTVNLLFGDLGYPKALRTLQAVVIQGTNVFESAPGTPYTGGSVAVSFQPTAGPAQLYAWAQPDATAGQGAYAAYLYDSSHNTVADIAAPVLDSSHFGYAYSSTLAAAGSYQLSLNDFYTPVAFSKLSAVAVQRGAALATLGSAGSTTFSASAAGAVSIVVFPVLMSANSNSLFSLAVADPSNTVIYQTTQGVGAAYNSLQVTISTPGAYVLKATDLGFPANFSTLAVIVTSGQSAVGTIFGSNKLFFNVAAAGTYVANVLAQVGAGVDYGLYGLNVAAAPPSPVISLNPSAASVASGGSATLTWSATNATSCAASATPTSTSWSGTVATSGSQSTGMLTADTTFSLSCSGDGGTTGASTQVAIQSSSGGGKGGGGTLTVADLLALLATAASMIRSRARLEPA
jgi:hypothetical protein